MADTKNLDRAERKATKRASRRALKAKVAGLTHKERKALRKHEGTTTEFLRELEQSEQGD